MDAETKELLELTIESVPYWRDWPTERMVHNAVWLPIEDGVETPLPTITVDDVKSRQEATSSPAIAYAREFHRLADKIGMTVRLRVWLDIVPETHYRPVTGAYTEWVTKTFVESVGDDVRLMPERGEIGVRHAVYALAMWRFRHGNSDGMDAAAVNLVFSDIVEENARLERESHVRQVRDAAASAGSHSSGYESRMDDPTRAWPSCID